MRSAWCKHAVRLWATFGPSTRRSRSPIDDSWLEIIGLGALVRANTEGKGECRIGAVAPLSDTLTRVVTFSGGSGMTPSSRDRISVDLQGLKAVLMERAQALGVSPSALVRKSLAGELGRPAEPMDEQLDRRLSGCPSGRARLCLRMERGEAVATLAAARRAGMGPGRYVAGLVAGVPVIQAGGGRAEHVAALMASSSEMSTLSRNIHQLTSLLRHGEVGPALVYRGLLNTLDGDIRRHLVLASGVLADLQPRGRTVHAAQRRTL